jgi:hypothetical protein
MFAKGRTAGSHTEREPSPGELDCKYFPAADEMFSLKRLIGVEDKIKHGFFGQPALRRRIK